MQRNSMFSLKTSAVSCIKMFYQTLPVTVHY